MEKGEKKGKMAIKSSHARKVSRVKLMEVEVNTREIEKREEDCVILDSDPNDSLIIHLSKLSISSDLEATGISVLAEKGEVACRDYPHSRHLCFNNPFEKTPHESYCELCYCFVCDKVAPCKEWYGVLGHCHAIDNMHWSFLRELRKERRERKLN